MRCTICGNEPPEELLHLPIYLNGSEGIEVCWACRIDITHFLHGVKSACARSRIAAVRSYRKEGQT